MEFGTQLMFMADFFILVLSVPFSQHHNSKSQSAIIKCYVYFTFSPNCHFINIYTSIVVYWLRITTNCLH